MEILAVTADCISLAVLAQIIHVDMLAIFTLIDSRAAIEHGRFSLSFALTAGLDPLLHLISHVSTNTMSLYYNYLSKNYIYN